MHLFDALIGYPSPIVVVRTASDRPLEPLGSDAGRTLEVA
jgi:hypothetical protein